MTVGLVVVQLPATVEADRASFRANPAWRPNEVPRVAWLPQVDLESRPALKETGRPFVKPLTESSRS